MTFGRRHRVLGGVGSFQSGRRKVSTWEPGGPVSRSFVWGAAIGLDNSINASRTGRGSSAKPFALWPTVKRIPQGATIKLKRLNWLSGFHSGILAMEPCVYMNLIIHKISQAQTKEKPLSFTWWPEPWHPTVVKEFGPMSFTGHLDLPSAVIQWRRGTSAWVGKAVLGQPQKALERHSLPI